MLPCRLQLPGHLVGYDSAHGVATQVIGTHWLSFADFPQVVRSHVLDPPERRLLPIMPHTLNCIKGLVAAHVTRQMAKSEHSADGPMHTKERRALAVGLDRDHTKSDIALFNVRSHAGDRSVLDENGLR